MLLRWLLSMFAVLLVGCASPRVRPNRSIQHDFQSIDELRIGEHLIDDPAIISRLAEIHARSKWAPEPITLPVGLITIECTSDGEPRFALVYSGWLWETNDDGELTRKATLSEDDREWMDQNIRTLAPISNSL